MYWQEALLLVLGVALGAASYRMGSKRFIGALAGIGVLLFLVLIVPELVAAKDPLETLPSGILFWSVGFLSFVVAPALAGRLGYWLIDRMDRRIVSRRRRDEG